MLQFFSKNKLENSLQSVYRKFHSTEESVLLKVENNIAISLDKGRVNALMLLDLSAGFDTMALTLH